MHPHETASSAEYDAVVKVIAPYTNDVYTGNSGAMRVNWSDHLRVVGRKDGGS